MTLGEKIQWGRRRCGLSQQQLAQKLCVSRSAIAKWETGKGLPDVDNLKLLSRLLGMTVDNLLDSDTAAVLEPCRSDTFPGCGRVQKDALMRRRFPGATIVPLLGRLEAPPSSLPAPTSLCRPVYRNREQAFYLVETEQEQLFVTVTDDFLELRPMEQPTDQPSFHLGSWHFLRLHPLP